jgi:hypothetical protein
VQTGTDRPVTHPARRAWTALAFVAALFGLALQPPAVPPARGANSAPAADINRTIDRHAVRPDTPAQAEAFAHKQLGANSGPLPAALPPAGAAPITYGPCRLPILYAGIDAPRSFTIVAQPRAPPIRRT